MRTFTYIMLLSCTGCASHYVAPGSLPTATVIFSSGAPSTDGVMVQTFADKHCSKSQTGTRVAYFYRDLFDQPIGTAKEVTAGRDFVFTFRSRSDTGTVATFCRLTRSFVPQAKQTYRAHFVSSSDSCDVKVTQIFPGTSANALGSPITVSTVMPVCFNDIDG
jgi:hypothetical protein